MKTSIEKENAELRAENQRLRAEVRELRKDAERYRWLRTRWGRIADEYDGDSDQLVAIRESDSHSAAPSPQGDAWQPIETAPKDGTRVLLATPQGRMADGEFHTRYGVWSWPYVMVEPALWRPLPTPPIDAAPKEPTP